jgi:hypothetical protein
MALRKIEGLRCTQPSSLRRTGVYASFLGISEALPLIRNPAKSFEVIQ